MDARTRFDPDTRPAMMRTVIIDADRRFASSVAGFIALQKGLRVVGLGLDDHSGLTALAAGQVELVLLGLTPAARSVAGALTRMRRDTGWPRVIGMVDSDAPIYVRALAPATVDTVICRTELPLLLTEILDSLFPDGPTSR